MRITIHRGIDQIGGCITEIKSHKGTKILIDLGHNLPNSDKTSIDTLEDPNKLNVIINGVSHIFILTTIMITLALRLKWALILSSILELYLYQ